MKQYRLLERQHPIFSPLALISTILLACGLAGWIGLRGGQAFSPGELSALNYSNEPVGGFFSHAEFEDDCNQCHAPFAGIETQRCEVCHSNIAEQRQSSEGLHSRFENVARCGDCHQEHKGQNFDQFAAVLVNFDHQITNFSLDKHLLNYEDAPLECTACHQNTGRKFTLVVNACKDCHQTAAVEFMATHTEAFGHDCLACHDGHDTLADFTVAAHAELFELVGLHASTRCEMCHAGGQFAGTATACVACHAEPDTHIGMFGADCTACHSPEGWLPATLDLLPFDHARDTGFSLLKHATNYNSTTFTCRICHTGSQPVSFSEGQCADCHQPADPEFMNGHLAQFGPNCLTCHTGTGEMTNFDHNQVWTLDGYHVALECTACHIDQVFKGTPGTCIGCHAEPTIHAGLFGTNCTSCHTTQAWQPAQLRLHSFPLDHGGQGEVACETCHTTTYIEYTCYNCHEHDPAATEATHLAEGIRQPELSACAQCHATGQEGIN